MTTSISSEENYMENKKENNGNINHEWTKKYANLSTIIKYWYAFVALPTDRQTKYLQNRYTLNA